MVSQIKRLLKVFNLGILGKRVVKVLNLGIIDQEVNTGFKGVRTLESQIKTKKLKFLTLGFSDKDLSKVSNSWHARSIAMK